MIDKFLNHPFFNHPLYKFFTVVIASSLIMLFVYMWLFLETLYFEMIPVVLFSFYILWEYYTKEVKR